MDKPYASHVFPGYEHIDFPFEQIKKIIRQQPLDWNAVLANIKGVYMIGKLYCRRKSHAAIIHFFQYFRNQLCDFYIPLYLFWTVSAFLTNDLNTLSSRW